MDYLKWANELFSKDTYATKTTGITIIDVKKTYAKCAITIDERHLNAVGHVMGGVIYTLADFCFAIASNTVGLTVTLNSHINYISSVKGINHTLYAQSNCIKSGKNVSYFTIDIIDENDVLIATTTTTGFTLKPQEN